MYRLWSSHLEKAVSIRPQRREEGIGEEIYGQAAWNSVTAKLPEGNMDMDRQLKTFMTKQSQLRVHLLRNVLNCCRL